MEQNEGSDPGEMKRCSWVGELGEAHRRPVPQLGALLSAVLDLLDS